MCFNNHEILIKGYFTDGLLKLKALNARKIIRFFVVVDCVVLQAKEEIVKDN